MQRSYQRPFAQYVKKANKTLQLVIEDNVEIICTSPEVGEEKRGDLKGIYVYKFRFHQQEYLIAYRYKKKGGGIELLWIDFYKVGSHENFYTELKKFLR